MRVLIVDDDVDTLELFLTLLKMWGHEVQALDDPTLALPLALKFLPEVVLLDLGMPQIDGFEVASRMRQHKPLDGTFLVAVTGFGREEDQAKARVAGFDAHLLKPVDLASLQLLLKKRPHPAPRSRRPLPAPQSARAARRA